MPTIIILILTMSKAPKLALKALSTYICMTNNPTKSHIRALYSIFQTIAQSYNMSAHTHNNNNNKNKN